MWMPPWLGWLNQPLHLQASRRWRLANPTSRWRQADRSDSVRTGISVACVLWCVCVRRVRACACVCACCECVRTCVCVCVYVAHPPLPGELLRRVTRHHSTSQAVALCTSAELMLMARTCYQILDESTPLGSSSNRPTWVNRWAQSERPSQSTSIRLIVRIFSRLCTRKLCICMELVRNADDRADAGCRHSMTSQVQRTVAWQDHGRARVRQRRLSVGDQLRALRRRAVRCAFFDGNLHSRMPLSFTPLIRLKRCHACDQ
jgi:hypothetical protein